MKMTWHRPTGEEGVAMDKRPLLRDEASQYLYACLKDNLRLWSKIELHNACLGCGLVCFLNSRFL